MIKRQNPDKECPPEDQMADVPQFVTFQVEGEAPQSFPIYMKESSTGTRQWAIFGTCFIKNEKCTLQFRAFVNKSKGKKNPWWWESKPSIADIEKQELENAKNAKEDIGKEKKK